MSVAPAAGRRYARAAAMKLLALDCVPCDAPLAVREPVDELRERPAAERD